MNAINNDTENPAPPSVSIIIPMHNCEAFVDDLLNSLLRQTFGDFEVICIDDGSSDGTLEKVHAFCEADSRFIALTQERGGAGAARNTGLDVARGTYVMFFDADDVYSETLLEEMVAAAEKHQVDEVFCFFTQDDYKMQKRIEHFGFKPDVFPENTPVKTSSIQDLYASISWWACNALYLRERIERYHLRFSATQVANDVFFIRAYASVTTSILGIHKHLLTYRKFINEKCTTSTRPIRSQDSVTARIELYEWLRSNQIYDRYKESYLEDLVRSIRYDAGLSFNPAYVDAITQALCSQGLFDEMEDCIFY
ncbi:MAG: glycosyltransferase family 2 protein, partial [Atopobiaceae bacterium]|nr:glycosyltransferase family 2 protein [Atopobiaceae bacterium]